MWQHFFQKEKRKLNPYIKKLADHENMIKYDKKDMDSYKGRWTEHFKNNNPIYLEIGSGSGNFAVRNAERYLDKNYIGVEIRFKRLVLSAIKAEKRDLKNVLFLRRRGEELLDFIAQDEITGMYINFPDPWDKKIKNRIIQVSLFEKIKNILAKGAKLYFKTDHKGYYDYVIEMFEGNQVKDFKIVYKTDDLYNSEKIETNISTEFEDLFVQRRAMKINYIEIEKEV